MRIFLFLCLWSTYCWHVSEAAEKISIQLRNDVEVHEPEIALAHLAEISGLNRNQIQRLGELDVTLIDAGLAEATISKERIQLRLLLAGLDQNAFALTGPAHVHVKLATYEPWTDERLLNQLTHHLAQTWEIPVADLRVELTAPFLESLPPSQRTAAALRLDPIPPLRLALGQLFLTVKVWDGQRFLGTRQVHCHVRRRYNVPTATRTLERLHELTTADIDIQERFLDQPLAAPSLQDCLGKRLSREIPALAPIQGHVLIRSATIPSRSLIRPSDTVQVVARSGHVRVTLQDAEALQAGNPGESIRLRNPTSRAIVSGTIREDGTVEVVLR